MTILRQIIEPKLLARLHELAAIVNSELAEKEQLANANGEEQKSYLGAHDTILPAFGDDEVRMLVAQYRLPESDVRDWGVLRLALYHFGWLGRRVSERTVPNSSIVFVALKADSRSQELTGLEGVVPLRASRCREHWGKQWAARFIQVEWARIAESRRDYERLLSGEITDVIPNEEDAEADEEILGAIS